MSWINGFITGGVTVILSYAFFSIGKEEEEEDVDFDETENSGLVVNDFTETGSKLHTLYCESCRKKKRHREVKSRVFECTRCKRMTDLRAS